MSEIPVVEIDRPSHGLKPRDGWIAIAWFCLYFTYLFRNPETELAHWITMVLIPISCSADS